MHTLSEAQKAQWETDGYLHLEGVLSADEVAFFSAEMDRIRALPGFEPDRNPDLNIGHYRWMEHAPDLDPGGFMDRRDLLPYDRRFLELIDAEPVFDYVVDLMGPNLLFSMSQAIARPSTSKFPGYTHTDGGEALRMVRPMPGCPPLAMKAMYLLTDVEAENCGNLTVFPGSHVHQIPCDGSRTITPESPGATQLMGRAGDVYLFPHALWHGPARNESGVTRKVLLYNYCQLWMRCYDFDGIPDIAQGATPRQRRLLGDLGYEFVPGGYFYVPLDQEKVICQAAS